MVAAELFGERSDPSRKLKREGLKSFCGEFAQDLAKGTVKQEVRLPQGDARHESIVERMPAG
jgi:hypothetical protein